MKSKDQQLLEEAYEKMNVTSDDKEFSYYSGPEEDIMYIDDLNPAQLKRKMLQEDKRFKTVFVAYRKDAVNYGYPDVPSHAYYVFYTPQDFAHPALIPI
jgi:hypothetical protein